MKDFISFQTLALILSVSIVLNIMLIYLIVSLKLTKSSYIATLKQYIKLLEQRVEEDTAFLNRIKSHLSKAYEEFEQKQPKEPDTDIDRLRIRTDVEDLQ